jgi:hypothetical protein
MSIPKLWKSKFSKISRFLLIFLLIFAWIFSGWPRIWQKPAILAGIKETPIWLSTSLLLTAILAFANLKIVNPPRAYFW